NQIPAIYQSLRLESAKPDVERHPLQADILQAMQRQPLASYALFGKNGCGKSLFGWLLYRTAVESGRSAVGVPLSELLAQFRAWEKEQALLP
ncbi:hypothetical protein ABFV57_31580, partial [Pseudomonas neuropathica]|uniref:hypothetical protein n=1 Tax=Pseudomonas neuropathica TaxID=2730425 RepID=UPI0034D5727A